MKKAHKLFGLFLALACVAPTYVAIAGDYTLSDSSNADFMVALPTLLKTESSTITNSGDNTYSGYTIEANNDSSIRYNLAVSGTGSLTVGNFNECKLGDVATSGVNLTLNFANNSNVRSVSVDGGVTLKVSSENGVWVDTNINFGAGGGTINMATSNFHLQGDRTMRTTAPPGTVTEPVKSTWNSKINFNGRSITFDTAANTELTLQQALWNHGYFTKTGDGTLVMSGENYNSFYQDSNFNSGRLKASDATTVSAGTLKFIGSGRLSTENLTLAGAEGVHWENLVPVVNNATIEFASNRIQHIRNLSGTNESALILNSAGAMELYLYNDTDTVYSGSIRGVESNASNRMKLTKDGAGTLQIAGKDTGNRWYFSEINVLDGKLNFASTARSDATFIYGIKIDNGSELIINGFHQLPIGGNIEFGANGGTITNANANLFNNAGTLRISTVAGGNDASFDVRYNLNGNNTIFDVAEGTMLTASREIWNNGGYEKTGAGKLVISESNTNRSATKYVERFVDLREGVVEFNKANAFGNQNRLQDTTIQNSDSSTFLSTIRLNANENKSLTLRPTAENLTIRNNVAINGVGTNTIDVTESANALTIERLGGTGTLVKTGAGTLILGGIPQSEIDAGIEKWTNIGTDGNTQTYYGNGNRGYTSPLCSSLDTLCVDDGAFMVLTDAPLTISNLQLSGGDYLINENSGLLTIAEGLEFSDGSQIIFDMLATGGSNVELVRFSDETRIPTNFADYVTFQSPNWLIETQGASVFAVANSSALPEPSTLVLLLLGFVVLLRHPLKFRAVSTP